MSQSNADDLLSRLSDTGRFWSVSFSELTVPEQVFRCVWELEGEVNNGGFDQYYFNSSGDIAFATVESLTRIGAHQTARIVDQANQVFEGGQPPQDRAKRCEALDSLGDATDVLERLDQQFFEYPDDLTHLLFDYVQRHKAEIQGSEAAGF